MRFVFDIRKAIAAAGYLCKLNDGSLDLLHLIKMLYIADRSALLKWHRTITGDKFYAMKNGPVLSRLYDLICGRVFGPEMDAWRATFNPRNGNMVSLCAAVDLDPLSQREMDELNDAFGKLNKVPGSKLIQMMHEILPEWNDPGASSAPIDPKVILLDSGLSGEEIADIERELDSTQSAKVSLQAT